MVKDASLAGSWGSEWISDVSPSGSNNWGVVFNVTAPTAAAPTVMMNAGYAFMCAGCGQNIASRGTDVGAVRITITRASGGYNATISVSGIPSGFAVKDVNMYLGYDSPKNAPGSWKPKPTTSVLVPFWSPPTTSFTATSSQLLSLRTGYTGKLYVTLHYVSGKTCAH
ncbi:hypothetical protein HYH03_015550 [Edaphochlamys debaryana]|uniref:Uncharacterized protein n=1 Tax=Edaphochlamys debaryana TaxID=47281 RepID=A0A836BQT3_9CHLO|nr:hypothetical protein HYH03_015550 [Edaphochlamys debaryana]|eukprot:KAG2485741.1 hypothetical protein HYH03_015550 [Edaphochlamys debaryana]